MTLPVTVILPTRNAMGVVEEHVRTLREIFQSVKEIVVVDSSEDGTLDFLKTALEGLPAKFFPRPRGLYEGWNYGASQATEEFVYYSTMGDTITLDGLQHLLEVAQAQSADVVLSPPTMVNEAGEPSDASKWPIHILCESMRTQDVHVFSRVESFLHSVSYLPATVLGSSASNVYRRSFLAENPFPEGWGHCADSAWMVSIAMKARIVLTTRELARFVIHAKEGAADAHLPTPEHYQDFFVRAEKTINDAMGTEGEKEVLFGWLKGMQHQREKLVLSLEARGRRIRHYSEKIAHLTGRVDILQGQATDYENQLKAANRKVVDLRAQISSFERSHRSFLRLLGLYLAAKVTQFQKLGALVRQKLKS